MLLPADGCANKQADMSKLIGILLQLSAASVSYTHCIPLKHTHPHSKLQLLHYLPQHKMIFAVPLSGQSEEKARTACIIELSEAVFVRFYGSQERKVIYLTREV